MNLFIQFLDANNGIMLASSYMGLTLRATTDGGETWNNRGEPYPLGLAVARSGDAARLYSGKTKIYEHGTLPVRDYVLAEVLENPLWTGRDCRWVEIASEDVVFVLEPLHRNGSAVTELRISRDAGRTWATSFVSTRLVSIHFVDARHGWAVGGAGKLSRTTDGGDNWIHTVLPTDEDLYAVHFVDQWIGWAAGGYVRHGSFGHGFPDGISTWTTADGGASWHCSPRIAFGRAEPHAFPETISGLVFRDRQEGWAVTHGMMKKSRPREYGRVLRTTNGGAAWEQVYLGEPLAKVVYKDGVLLAAGNHLLRSEDGITWEDVMAYGPIKGIAFANSRHALAVGSGYLESWDAGATWQTVTPPPFQKTYLWTVGFTDEATGWIGSSSIRDTPGGAYHTVDAGRSWQPRMIHEPGDIGPYDHGTLREICTLETGHAWALWTGGIFRLAGPQAGRVDSEP